MTGRGEHNQRERRPARRGAAGRLSVPAAVFKGLVLALTVLFAAALLAPALAAALPGGVAAGEEVYAETAGQDLVVRVGYFGDDKDYREKAVLTREDMEALAQEEGSVIYEYANVTRVGTVMGTIARGPTVTAVLTAAGIDLNSVQTLNLRTTDGTKVNNWFVSLNMDQWVWTDRYWYPYLRSNYERVEDDDESVDQETGMMTGAVLPKEGALRGRAPVPSILAIESFTTKDPGEELDASMMGDSNSYRFCSGQTVMTEGEECRNFSSMNSAQWVFGIDVTLFGRPGDATGLDLMAPDAKDLVVGSKAQIGYQIYGHELFGDKVNGRLTWKSSDPSVAKVDRNGVVTVLKAGTVTITATTKNGISQSVTIKCLAGKRKKQKKPVREEEKPGPAKTPEKKTVTVQQETPATPARPGADNRLKQPEQNRHETKKESEASGDRDSGRDGREEEQKKVSAGMREIVLGDMSGGREEMEAQATPLDAQQRSPYAGAAALGGTGFCAACGALIKLLMYLKEVR